MFTLSLPKTILLFVILSLFYIKPAKVSAQVLGSVISGAVADIEKSNQSQVFYHDNTWWGVFRTVTNNKWSVAKLSGGSWSLNVESGIVSNQSADAHVNTSTNKLYFLVSKGTEQFTRLSYSAGNWTEDSGFPISIDLENIFGNDPATIAQAADGDLFIFYVSGDSVKALYSNDDGLTFSRVTITTGVGTGSITDGIDFTYNSVGQVGLFIGDAGSSSGFQFYRLPDTDDPATPSNWISESLPSTGEDADDHVNIVRDSAHNLYMIGKNKKSPPPYFFLYKRNNNATWERVLIDGFGATRPALTINSSTNTLVVGATNNSLIQYVLLDKDNLSNVDASDWVTIIQNGTDTFNNVTLSYQVLSNSSDVLFAAENTTAGTIWYNTLNNPDYSLPVELSSFNAIVGKENITLNWVTQSELNSAFFILERALDSLDFEEIGTIKSNGNSSVVSNYAFVDYNIEKLHTYRYRLSELAIDGQLSILRTIKVSSSVLPSLPELAQNFPNPFNPQTIINYFIPTTGKVKLELYNEAGQKVRVLVNQIQPAGSYSFTLYAGALPSGTYFYRLTTASGFSQSKKLLLVR